MSQHLTDSFNGHTFFERNQRGERVPPHVIPEVGLQSGDDTQDFHVRPESAVMLRGQQRFPRVVLILLYQATASGSSFTRAFSSFFLRRYFSHKLPSSSVNRFSRVTDTVSA